MTAIGSLVFCNDCGNLLDSSTSIQQVKLSCGVCGSSFKDSSTKTVTTTSKPSAFPSTLRAKRSDVQTLTENDRRTEVAISMPCEKCGEEQVRYYTQQLRSADEGTTVFYSCYNPKCGHRWLNNN